MTDEINTQESVNLKEVIHALDLNLLRDSSISHEVINNNRTETRTVNVTPHLAEFLLSKHTVNRPLNAPNVAKITKDMLNGDWNFDSNTIVFDKYGNLIDGRHRLNGVVLSKKTIPFKISTGHLPEIFATMDTGKVRTGSDVLGIAGYANHTLYAQTANFMFKFLRGSITQNATKPSRNAAQPNSSLSHVELLEFVRVKPFINDSVNFALSMKKRQSTSLISNYMIAGLFYLFNEKDPDKAVSFMERLLITESDGTSPIFHLRNRLLNAKYDKMKSLQYQEKVKLIILAWNYYRIGKKVKVLKVPDALPSIM